MEVDDDGVAIRQVKPHPGVQCAQVARKMPSKFRTLLSRLLRARPKSVFQPSSGIVSFLVIFTGFT